MRTHTADFKNTIKQFGKEINAKITYTSNNSEIVLSGEQLNSVSYHYEGAILKSVMKQLDIDSNTDIPLNTLINLKFGVKVSGSYEYLDYGNFIVYKSEKQEDTGSYKITCYDKLLYSMINYETPKISGTAITYPITVRNYISAICSHLGLTFANSSDTFVNYDKAIPSELYIDSDGNSLGYTFRDILDELAEVTASIICINDDDELEIRYIPSIENLIDIPYFSGTLRGIRIISSGNEISLNGAYTSSVDITVGSYLTYRETIDIPAGNYIVYVENMPLHTNIVVTFRSEDNILLENITLSANSPTKSFTLSQKAIQYSLLQNIIFEKDVEISFNSSHQIYLIDRNFFDTIDEEYLKDINVNFGERYGPINTVVLSRSGGADKISQSYPTDLSDNLKNAIVIEDNQIMNDNNRSEFMADILSQLYGLQYHVNDYSSPGICYYELGDRYNVSIGNENYSCVMLNDEINITQGLEELVHTDMPGQAEVEYTKTTESDKVNTIAKRAYIIANKAEGTIEATVSAIGDNSGNITPASILLAINDDGSIIKLAANKLDLNGSASFNNRVVIDLQGFLHMYGGDIELEDTGEDSDPKIIIYDENSVGTSKIMINEDLSGKTLSFTWPTAGSTTSTRVVNNGVSIEGYEPSLIESSGGYKIIVQNSYSSSLNYNEYVALITPSSTRTYLYSYNMSVIVSLSSYQLPNDFGKITFINASYGTQNYIYSPIGKKRIITLKSSGLEVWNKENGIVTEYEADGVAINSNDGDSYYSKNGIYSSIMYNNEKTFFQANSSLFKYETGHPSNSSSSKIELTNNIGNHSDDVFSVYIDGSLQIRANSSGAQCRSLGTLSSEKIKKNFEKLSSGIDLVLKTEVYKYHLIEQKENEKKHIGFVIGKKYNCADEIISNSNDSIDIYSGLGVAFKAIQDQQEMINKQQEQINDLIKKVEILERNK